MAEKVRHHSELINQLEQKPLYIKKLDNLYYLAVKEAFCYSTTAFVKIFPSQPFLP